MSHEPECTFLNEPKSVSGSCWCCAGIRSAYKRGRGDAAAAIEHLESYHYDMVWVRLAVAAARGDADKVANATLSDKPCTGSCLLKGHLDAQCQHTPTPGRQK